ncbi:MAG: methyltransferase domain-containing protein [Pseudomonadales bacterium]
MSKLNDILACPRCGTALQALHCNGCQMDYPTHDGVPWLVADPPGIRSEWRNRWQAALADLESRQKAARDALDRTSSTAATERLSSLADGYTHQHHALRSLLSSLGLARPADLETYLALKTRLPSQMGLTSYQANVFRDWCWGGTENSASHDTISNLLAPMPPESMVVLGAGAGRLAYDLHQSLGPDLSVSLEINPYLTMLLKKLAGGDNVDLTEFPLAPSSGARSAIRRTLSAPAVAAEGFEVILADAMRPPFLPASFDVVITPWLVDVIDAEPRELLAEINQLLKPGGHWIYHGSVGFTRAQVAENINLEELLEMAADRGFTDISSTERASPYLDCPDSRHGRIESIVTMMAKKVEEAVPATRHQNLPDWIAKGRAPVPALASFRSQAMVTRIHALIMSLIDGKRTLKDMAEVMEAQQLMPKDEAESAIRGFLIKMLDEARSGRAL